MKLIRTNMAEKRVTTENAPDNYAIMGGRALTTEVIRSEERRVGERV